MRRECDKLQAIQKMRPGIHFTAWIDVMGFLPPLRGQGVTLITPCPEGFKTSSVDVTDGLVWELGQTYEVARNGHIIKEILYLIMKNQCFTKI